MRCFEARRESGGGSGEGGTERAKTLTPGHVTEDFDTATELDSCTGHHIRRTSSSAAVVNHVRFRVVNNDSKQISRIALTVTLPVRPYTRVHDKTAASHKRRLGGKLAASI